LFIQASRSLSVGDFSYDFDYDEDENYDDFDGTLSSGLDSPKLKKIESDIIDEDEREHAPDDAES
jgi:hypothetical protein